VSTPRYVTLEDLPVGQDAEGALVQVHDGVVDALVAVDDRVRVQADDQVVAELSALLQEILTFKKILQGSGRECLPTGRVS
jgi:hypothetical protein